MNTRITLVAVIAALVGAVAGAGIGWSYSNVSPGKGLSAMESSAQIAPKATDRYCARGELVTMGSYWWGCYYNGRITGGNWGT